MLDWRARPSSVAGILLFVGLLLRAAYSWHGHNAGYLPTNSDQYEDIAINLVERGEFSVEPGNPTSKREPSYPLFIASVYAVAGRQPGLIIASHCVLSLATAWMLWLLSRRIFSDGIALSTLAVFVFYPQSVYYTAFFFRETWLTFWFTLLMYSSVRWLDSDRWALIGGLAATAFGMSNSAVLPACALAGILLFFAVPKEARLRRFALYTLPLVLAFSAWSYRNWRIHGQFVAGSTHGGEEFYQALIVPPADLGTQRQIDIVSSDPVYKAAERLPEAARNSMLIRESFRWIAAHPGVFVSRAVAGVLKFWKLWPYKRNYHHSYAKLVIASLLSDAWIVPLGLLGLWLFRSRWRELSALYAGAIMLTLVYGGIHAVIRYRMPLMGGMIMLACATAASLRPYLTRR